MAPLHGKSVLVTRAQHQANGLIKSLQQQGANPIQLPAVEIIAAGKQPLQNWLGQYDWLIFVSRNAVDFFFDLKPQLPPDIKIAAVGKATTDALNLQGHQTSVMPSKNFDSEGLLALDELQQVQDQNILIVRGKGGRELLADTLNQRGASVEYAEVYERRLPQTDTRQLCKSWDEQIDVVTVTSNNLLDNLIKLLRPLPETILFQTPLVVISQRMLTHAQQLGFKNIWLADSAADDEIVKTIKKHLPDHRD